MPDPPPACQVCGQPLNTADGPTCLACRLRPGLSTVGEIYARFQASQPEGKAADFAALCSAHPDSEAELRRLHEAARQNRTSKASTWTSPGEPFVPPLPPAPAPPATSPGAPARLHPAAPSGGRYHIQGVVARGGMGVIYAVHDRELNRQIAMKVIGTNLAGADPIPLEALPPSWVDRFVEEAQITAQLDHPNIVPVHEIGFDAQGRIYFTMKLVQGRALHEIFALARRKSEGWNLNRAVGVLVRACEAVAHAHERGVVHRDLKPQNIMVGRLGEVYVMDWGLAKAASRSDLHNLRPRDPAPAGNRPPPPPGAVETGDSPLVTLDGTVLGTPAYMSPEHAEGRIDAIGVPSDVYSLGTILYELLTGHPPYVRPGQRQSPRAVLEAVRAGQLDPLEHAARDQPAELVAIGGKAMRRDAAARYRNAGELADDLQAWLDHRVVRAHRTGALAELKAWILRNRLAAFSQAAGVILIVGTLLAVAWLQQRANRHLSRQVYAALVTEAAEQLQAGEHPAAARLLEGARPEHRGWEWRHLERWAHSWQTNVLCQESPGLVALAVSVPRGWFVTAGPRQPLRLRSLAEGRELARFGPTNATLLALDPTGSFVVAAGGTAPLSAWELPSGRLHRQWSLPTAPRTLAFAGSEPVFATGSSDGSVTLWDLATDQAVAALDGQAPVTALMFAQREAHPVLFIGDAEGKVRQWLVATTNPATEVGRLPGEVRSLGTDARGAQLVTGNTRLSRSAGLRRWNLEEGWDQDLTVPAGFSDLWSTVLDPSERHLLACAYFGHLLIADLNTGRLDAVLSLAGRELARAAFLGSDTEILTWSENGEVLRLTRGRLDHVQLPGPPGQLRTVLFDPTGDRLQVASRAEAIFDWQIDTRTLLRRLPVPDATVVALARTRDGSRFVAADLSESLCVLDAVSGAIQATIETASPKAEIWWLDIHPDDRQVAVGCTDGTVRLLNLGNLGWDRPPVIAHAKAVEGLRFSPDGTTLGTCSHDGSVALWRTSDWKLIWRRDSGTSACRDISFSADGLRLAHGNFDGSAHVRSVRDGHLLVPPLSGHHGRVMSVAFAPDGTRLFTGANDGTVKVWDAEIGVLLLTLPVTTRSPVWDVAVSPDGSRVAAADGEGTVTVWFGDLP